MRCEALFDGISEKVDTLNEAIAGFESAAEDIAELEKYYGSREWKEDFAADEAGKLPADLKRGVLSEDAVYDLLEEICRLKKLTENV